MPRKKSSVKKKARPRPLVPVDDDDPMDDVSPAPHDNSPWRCEVFDHLDAEGRRDATTSPWTATVFFLTAMRSGSNGDAERVVASFSPFDTIFYEEKTTEDVEDEEEVFDTDDRDLCVGVVLGKSSKDAFRVRKLANNSQLGGFLSAHEQEEFVMVHDRELLLLSGEEVVTMKQIRGNCSVLSAEEFFSEERAAELAARMERGPQTKIMASSVVAGSSSSSAGGGSSKTTKGGGTPAAKSRGGAAKAKASAPKSKAMKKLKRAATDDSEMDEEVDQEIIDENDVDDYVPEHDFFCRRAFVAHGERRGFPDITWDVEGLCSERVQMLSKAVGRSGIMWTGALQRTGAD